jgi:hypothetical protein
LCLSIRPGVESTIFHSSFKYLDSNSLLSYVWIITVGSFLCPTRNSLPDVYSLLSLCDYCDLFLQTHASTQWFGDVSPDHQMFFFSVINVVFTLCNFIFNWPNKSIPCTRKIPPYCSTIFFVVFTQHILFSSPNDFIPSMCWWGVNLGYFPLLSHISLFPFLRKIGLLTHGFIGHDSSRFITVFLCTTWYGSESTSSATASREAKAHDITIWFFERFPPPYFVILVWCFPYSQLHKHECF